MNQQRLEEIKGIYVSSGRGLMWDTIRELVAEVERLQANQKRLIEAANATLEYFRIEGQYGPGQRGFARLSVEGKLEAAIANLKDGEEQ